MLQAFEVEDELRAHELDSSKPIFNIRPLAFWGLRSTSVVVDNLGFENEVEDMSVVLAAETAMLVNFGGSLE
jgi:hypothetical protein